MLDGAAVKATAQGLFAVMQVATFANETLTIPPNMSLVIEIGTSDRNTLDVELLPQPADRWLLSLEPLSDKYARGLARNGQGGGDHFQPLGHHHARGLIVPFAVGDVPTEGGAMKTINVGLNAGCSSLLPINTRSNRLKWCSRVAERRQVPTVSLEAVLGWAPGRPVEFIKVDAQGLDATIIASARGRLGSVRSFALEVISDDCHTLYVGQPRCSGVVEQAAKLGFAPATALGGRVAGSAHGRYG